MWKRTGCDNDKRNISVVGHKFVTQILRNGQPSHVDDRKALKVMKTMLYKKERKRAKKKKKKKKRTML